jgi:hypothetical protein
MGLLAAHISGSAASRVAEVFATATVVQPTSVMESFSPSMPPVVADKNWSTLKIVATVAPAPQQAAGALSVQGESPQRSSVAGSAASPPAPAAVPVASAAAGAAATGSPALLKGSITAALQVMPVAAGASPEAPGVMRFIVAFN